MTKWEKLSRSKDSASRNTSSKTATGTRITLLEPHSEACWYVGKEAISYDRKNVWCCPEYRHICRDTFGRQLKHGIGNGFLVYRCLCPECPARIAVLVADVDIAIGLEETDTV